LLSRAGASVCWDQAAAQLVLAVRAMPGARGVDPRERFITVCEGGDMHGLIGLFDPEVAGFLVVIGLGAMPGVRGAAAVAGRAMHSFGPLAGVSLQPFDLDGSLSSGGEIARQYGRHERWGRLVKRIQASVDRYASIGGVGIRPRSPGRLSV
jgi:hypothetical protein